MRAKGYTFFGENIYYSPAIDRVIRFSVPFILGIAYIIILSVLYDDERFFQITGLMLLYFIPPAGKESIIPAGIAFGIPWQVICFSIIFIDLISCIFMLWNFDLICRIPRAGRWIQHIMNEGRVYLSRHTWMEHLYMVGLITVVFMPLQGTGAVGGSILGKMLGLRSIEIFTAILIGSTLHSLVIGLSVSALQVYFDLNLWYLVGVITLLILIISVISYAYHTNSMRTSEPTEQK